MSRSIRRWQVIRDDVAQSLTRVKPEFLGDWKEALRPVRAELLGPLGTIFRNHELGELQQRLATSTLADYAADDVRLLADLLEDADPRQFAELFPVLARHGEAAISELERELETVIRPRWADAPPDAAWRDVTADVRRAIEAAAGMVEERFVLCQTMPYPRFRERRRATPRLRLSSHCESDHTVLASRSWSRRFGPATADPGNGWVRPMSNSSARATRTLRREGYVTDRRVR